MINLKKRVEKWISWQLNPLREDLVLRIDSTTFATGQVLARTLAVSHVEKLCDAEFKVFSQYGEDGILQYLTRIIPNLPRRFVEIGVESYEESNTRFLLMHDNWSGVIVDGGSAHVEFLNKSGLIWRHDIEPVTAMVTRENINDVLSSAGVSDEIGLLSLDIDGVDYWVLEAIAALKAHIVVLEYNSRFGARRAVTVPYRADFCRSKAHYSNCYFGASLKAFCILLASRGFSFVGCNSSGNNAFFVRRVLLPQSLRELTAEEGFVKGCFRESRASTGELSLLSPEQEAHMLRGLPLLDVVTGQTILFDEACLEC